MCVCVCVCVGGGGWDGGAGDSLRARVETVEEYHVHGLRKGIKSNSAGDEIREIVWQLDQGPSAGLLQGQVARP